MRNMTKYIQNDKIGLAETQNNSTVKYRMIKRIQKYRYIATINIYIQ